MRKVAFFLAFSLLLSMCAHGDVLSDFLTDNHYAYSPEITLSFTRTAVVIKNDGDGSSREFSVSYEQVSDSLYVTIPMDIDYSQVSFRIRKGRYLVLFGGTMLALYSGDAKDAEIECGGMQWLMYSISDFSAVASSSLSEKNVRYSTDYMTKNWIGRPWVEGQPGSGVGESLTFKLDVDQDEHPTIVRVLNGFVSYSRPELYRQNNRVKSLDVFDAKGAKVATWNLEDRVGFSGFYFQNTGSSFRIVITSVFEGSKYADTCITMVTPRMAF